MEAPALADAGRRRLVGPDRVVIGFLRAVYRAIPFKAFNTDDPVFRLSIDRALWVCWERVGEPGTRPIRQRWRAPGRGPRTT